MVGCVEDLGWDLFLHLLRVSHICFGHYYYYTITTTLLLLLLLLLLHYITSKYTKYHSFFSLLLYLFNSAGTQGSTDTGAVLGDKDVHLTLTVRS